MGSLAAAGARRDSPDSVFRQAMLEGTVTASFCPEDFSVQGLLAMNAAAFAARLGALRGLMTP